MKKKCLTCEVDNISMSGETVFNENKIPDWYKKNGNYSLLPKILNCEDKYNANKNDLVPEYPDITNTEVRVPINDEKLKDKWIFYWAANASKNPLIIKTPKEAYDTNQNRGLLELNSDGFGEMILNCPQPYKVDGITYPGHVHYVSLNADKTWDMNVLTKDIICYIDNDRLQDVIESRDHILVNASEIQDKEIKSINITPESLNISNKKKKLILEIKKAKLTLNKLESVDVLDVPIVLYTTSQNDEIKNLMNHFLESGFSNLTLYKKDSDSDEKKDSDSDEKKESLEFENESLFNMKKDTKEKLVVITGSKNIVYNHDIETGELTFNKNNKDIYIGKWDGRMPINWDNSIEAVEINKQHSEIYNKNYSDDSDDGESSSSDDDDDIKDKSEEDGSSSSSSDDDDDVVKDDDDDVVKDDVDDVVKDKDVKRNNDGDKSSVGGSKVDTVKLRKLKQLLSGGSVESKSDGIEVFQKDAIQLKKKSSNDKSSQENFRGWGWTFFQ